MRARHTVLKVGAAVRLHGYMPARVIVTVRRTGIGPHGYRPGQRVRVYARDAVPRDLIRVKRGSHGRLCWPSYFRMETGSVPA